MKLRVVVTAALLALLARAPQAWALTASGFNSLNSIGGTAGESQPIDVSANVTASISVLDTTNGLAVSDGFGVMYSTNAGQTWIDSSNATSVNVNAGASLHSLAVFGTSLFATDSNGSIVYSSPDGTTWTGATVGANPLPLVVFSGALYTGDSGGNVYSTTDGTNWTAVTAPSASAILSLAVFGGSRYAGCEPLKSRQRQSPATRWKMQTRR